MSTQFEVLTIRGETVSIDREPDFRNHKCQLSNLDGIEIEAVERFCVDQSGEGSWKEMHPLSLRVDDLFRAKDGPCILRVIKEPFSEGGKDFVLADQWWRERQ